MAKSCMTVIDQAGVKVVEFDAETELDAAHTEQIQPTLYELAEGQKAARILVDLANVRFASSQALGCLMALRLKAARNGARVALSGMRANLADIMSLTQLDKLYEIYPSRSDALVALAER